MRYFLKNLAAAVFLFFITEATMGLSALHNRNFFVVSPMGRDVQASYLLWTSLVYNLLYFFLLTLVSHYLLDRHRGKFLSSFGKKFFAVSLLGFLLRGIVNAADGLVCQWSDSLFVRQFMILCMEILYIGVLFFFLFRYPLWVQKKKLPFSPKAAGALIIIAAALLASVFLITRIETSAISQNLQYQMEKFQQPNLTYLMENGDFRLKWSGILLTFAAQTAFFLFFVFRTCQYYESYEKISKPSPVVQGFARVVLVSFMGGGLWAGALLLGASLFPLSFPYTIQAGSAGARTLEETFHAEVRETIISRQTPEGKRPVWDMTQFTFFLITKKIETDDSRGFPMTYERQLRTFAGSLQLEDITYQNPELAMNTGLNEPTSETPLYLINRRFQLDKIEMSDPFTLVKTNAIFYQDSSGAPQVVYFPEMGMPPKDDTLTRILEQAVNTGYFDFVEGAADYLLTYDRAFIEPILERYRNGDFTDAELQNNRQIREDYMMGFAKGKR